MKCKWLHTCSEILIDVQLYSSKLLQTKSKLERGIKCSLFNLTNVLYSEYKKNSIIAMAE